MNTPTTETLYEQLGISKEVWAFGQKTEEKLKERFEEFDRNAEYNQLKVIHAMQENRVSEGCFNYVSGYGYNDQGRDTLEDVYASVFHTEAALVRPQITCGTHALALALAANLRPGDTLLSPVGKPYDSAGLSSTPALISKLSKETNPVRSSTVKSSTTKTAMSVIAFLSGAVEFFFFTDLPAMLSLSARAIFLPAFQPILLLLCLSFVP